MRTGLVASIVAVAIAVGAAPLTSAPAAAQNADLQQLLDRLTRVERDIRTLNLQVARGDAAGGGGGGGSAAVAGDGGGGPAMARLSIRVTQVEDDLRSLTGRIEEILHKVDQVSNRFDKLVGDVDYRLTALEQRAGGAPAPGSSLPATTGSAAGAYSGTDAAGAPAPQAAAAPPAPTQSGVLGTMTQRELDQGRAQLPTASEGAGAAPAATSAAAVALPAGSTRERYNYAYGLLRQARYDEAEEAFEQFLTAHPGDPLAQNAQYWLGKVYFVREEYVLAAKTFTENYKAYPDGPKAPDSLLNLGLSLSRLDKKSAACAAFDELKRKFPKVSPRIDRTVKTQWDANGCR